MKRTEQGKDPSSNRMKEAVHGETHHRILCWSAYSLILRPFELCFGE